MEMKSGMSTTTSQDSGAYTDLNRLAALKTGDKNSDANLRKVASEFESLFMGEMLKSMRSANDVLAKDNPLNTEEAKQYQSMYDQQLAVNLSRGGGIGLQDVLMRQLSKNKNTTRPGGNPFAQVNTSLNTTGTATTTASGKLVNSLASTANKKLTFAGNASNTGVVRNDVAALNARRLSLPSKLSDRLLAGIVPGSRPVASIAAATTASTATTATRTDTAAVTALVASATDDGDDDSTFQTHAMSAADRTTLGDDDTIATTATVAQIPYAPSKTAFASHDEFVATMMPMAKEAAARIGVDPKILVAQAALETGWGKSVMRSNAGGSSHNLFGIKASSSWQGDQAKAITSEFRNGQMVKETANFRSYDSYADSFHDLVSTLQNNDRYQDVVKAADNPEQFVKELQKAGYATDPNYASKISSIAKQMQAAQSYASTSSSTTNL
ncbi:flagellar assembly peptidoglycan hydrolase FlgJ [Pseudomonas sp. dw_358]|uniref:flagellar assembly peptidoglycan hydrolase FlgJ n=1 Tax=Pseudomonas sp. dw_358 TaxID=2720083 RepID=UPI001BD1F4AE|nr:flagellar assembly peptidoglycan hydrolase FlgJ [Pseudomonas sp. dw_358]